MASGTGERPLPDPAQEKELLGLSGLRSMWFGVNANSTVYLKFPGNAQKYGVIFFDGAATTKRGMLQYGAGTNSAIHITQIVTPSQSGTSVAAGGNASNNPVWVKVTNGTNYLYGMVLAYNGPLPTVETTQPT